MKNIVNIQTRILVVFCHVNPVVVYSIEPSACYCDSQYRTVKLWILIYRNHIDNFYLFAVLRLLVQTDPGMRQLSHPEKSGNLGM